MDELNRLLADFTFNIPDQDFTIVTPKVHLLKKFLFSCQSPGHAAGSETSWRAPRDVSVFLPVIAPLV